MTKAIDPSTIPSGFLETPQDRNLRERHFAVQIEQWLAVEVSPGISPIHLRNAGVAFAIVISRLEGNTIRSLDCGFRMSFIALEDGLLVAVAKKSVAPMVTNAPPEKELDCPENPAC